MKKIVLIIVLVAVGLGLSAQYQEIANGESGLSVRTKMNDMHSELYELSLTTQYASAIPFWHDDYVSGDVYIRFSSDLGVTYTPAIYMFDGSNIENDLLMNGYTISGLPTPTLSDEAATKSYVDGKSSGVDSITYDDDLYFRVYLGGSVVDSALINTSQSYTITLPVNGTLSGSVTAAVEGTDYPTGWVLSSSGGNLQINHGQGKYPNIPVVKYNTTGTTYRQLRSFDNAYSGVQEVDDNNITIESISTFYTSYKLKIKISF